VDIPVGMQLPLKAFTAALVADEIPLTSLGVDVAAEFERLTSLDVRFLDGPTSTG
jgi:hypothetical protein